MIKNNSKIIKEIVADILIKVKQIAPNAVLNTANLDTLSIEYGELESTMAAYRNLENKIIIDKRYINMDFKHVLTHELIHVLSTNNFKTGLDVVGMTAVNEGITECLTIAIMGGTNKIVGYFDSTMFTLFLGKMIGFEKMFQLYFKNDEIELLNEFRKIMKNDDKVVEILKLLNENFTTSPINPNSKLPKILGKMLYQYLEKNEYSEETLSELDLLVNDTISVSQDLNESYSAIKKLPSILDLYRFELSIKNRPKKI